MKKFLLWPAGILATFSLIGVVSCNTEANKQNLTDTSKVTSTPDTSHIAPSTGWTYSENEDKMTSKKTYHASIDAKELLHFDAPYDGGCAAVLFVRKMAEETDVFVQFSKAQLIIDSYDGSNFRVRFDDKPSSTYTFVSASDHSSDVAFLKNTSKFLKNLKNSKKVIIEMEFYQQGTRAIEFDTEGLQWNH